MQNQEVFSIQNATFQELKTIGEEWVNKEGWNPGNQDAKCFWAADSEGFFVGKLNGKMIGCVSAVKYKQGKFGFVGLYIVLPQYRGRGYGLKLFMRGLEYLNGYNIGLDGVIAQQDNYKKSGFKYCLNHMRYEILGLKKPQNYVRNHNIRDYKKDQIQFQKISSYDREMFPSQRKEFLRVFFQQKQTMTASYCDSQGNVKGYGVVRKSAQGYRIGPLFADSTQISSQLLKQFIYFIGQGQKAYIDVPDTNVVAVKFIQKFYSVIRVFECARMYTGEPPKVNIDKIYGTTTLQLG